MVSKAVVAFLSENQMIEERNPNEFAGLTQLLGQDAIFGTGRAIARGVIVGTCDVKSR